MAAAEAVGAVPVHGVEVGAIRVLVVIGRDGTGAIGVAGVGPGAPGILFGNVFANHERVREAIFDVGEFATILVVHAPEDTIALVYAIEGAILALITAAGCPDHSCD